MWMANVGREWRKTAYAVVKNGSNEFPKVSQFINITFLELLKCLLPSTFKFAGYDTFRPGLEVWAYWGKTPFGFSLFFASNSRTLYENNRVADI